MCGAGAAAAQDRRALREGDAVAYYLEHRGWVVETQRHVLVFDAEEFGVIRPAEPSLTNGFLTSGEIGDHEVIALYTCYHGEIGQPAYIHEIEDSLASVTYVHNAGDRWSGSEGTVHLSPREQVSVGDVDISTIAVTETMTSLGYLVKVDGLVVYYAGFHVEDLTTFRQGLQFLAARTDHVDLAFLPLIDTPDEDREVSLFLTRLKPAVWLVHDPNRREERFGEMTRKAAEWGFEGQVFTPQRAGDRFVYTRPGPRGSPGR